MFSTCIFCNRPLGTNEMVETFPVGRRLAFDGSKGRLWVVCRRCERWNLTPMDERWEAIEECERLFASTRPKRNQGAVGKLPAPTKLAIEMALHEEQERRALAGELLELEAAWRQAEEIANIADNLLVPVEAERFIAEHRESAEPGEHPGTRP